MRNPQRRLRVGLLAYRGNPFSGGQGVYTRKLANELVRLGHSVEVLSGQPYPVLDPPVSLVEIPSLDLYRADSPFRPHRLPRDWIDLVELAQMCTATFPEPLTFSWRADRWLRRHPGRFDIIHDNQSLGYGILRIARRYPVLATIHHPITVDRRLDLEHAGSWRRRMTLRRWYGFIRMQVRVASRLPRVVTVSDTSRRDIIAEMGVDPSRIDVVPVGVDPEYYKPRPQVAVVPGRLLAITSSDVPLKGLSVLLEALAKLRTERDHAHLVVVGRMREEDPARRTVKRFGLGQSVEFTGSISDDRLKELYGQAEVAVVPSLYEGFSLPAVQAMASGLPLVATRAGAIPEVAGTDGETALLVPPGDPSALAAALKRALDDEQLRSRLGAAARERALSRFTWEQTARGTLDRYYEILDTRPPAATC